MAATFEDLKTELDRLAAEFDAAVERNDICAALGAHKAGCLVLLEAGARVDPGLHDD